MKICLVCSHGGHLTEMMQLIDAFEGHDVFMVTQGSKSVPSSTGISGMRTHVIRDFMDKPNFRFLRNLLTMWAFAFHGLRVLLQERPDLIVSTGSEIALPVCYLGKMLRKKIIFVDTLTRIYDLSTTGKLIYPIADLFLVQWEGLIPRYKKAKYWGKIIWSS